MSSKRFVPFASAIITVSVMLSMAAPLTLNAQGAATPAATEVDMMASTAAAGALPAACGTTPGTVADIVAKIVADPAKKSPKPKSIGFLFVGPVDDFGYNYAANQGRLCIEAIWPGSTVYAENVPENAEAERVMEKMIQDGATIIFPTSYGHLY